jgi:hypothetical protein
MSEVWQKITGYESEEYEHSNLGNTRKVQTMRTSYIDLEHAYRVADEYKTANEKNMAEKFEAQKKIEAQGVEEKLRIAVDAFRWIKKDCMFDRYQDPIAKKCDEFLSELEEK